MLAHTRARTGQGFLCLMQVSTRKADYLVDLIELRGAAGCPGQPLCDAAAPGRCR